MVDKEDLTWKEKEKGKETSNMVSQDGHDDACQGERCIGKGKYDTLR